MSKGQMLKEGYKKLTIGMLKWKVIEMFGEPDSIKVHGNIETYTWWSNEFKGIFRGGRIERRVMVEFDNDIICGYDGENVNLSSW